MANLNEDRKLWCKPIKWQSSYLDKIYGMFNNLIITHLKCDYKKINTSLHHWITPKCIATPSIVQSIVKDFLVQVYWVVSFVWQSIPGTFCMNGMSNACCLIATCECKSKEINLIASGDLSWLEICGDFSHNLTSLWHDTWEFSIRRGDPPQHYNTADQLPWAIFKH